VDANTLSPPLGDYAPADGSPVINYIVPGDGEAWTVAPQLDFFGTNRKPTTRTAFDIGAIQHKTGAASALAIVTGAPLGFGSVVQTTTSAPQTLTLHNDGFANLTGIAIVVSPPFARPAGAAGGTCPAGGGGGGGGGATLAAGATCTINVVFSPTLTTLPGAITGSATITASVPVEGSQALLTGTAVAPTYTATLIPTTWSATANRGVGPGAAGRCTSQIGPTFGPCQTFTLTNTGNVTLTTIAAGVLGGTNPADWSIVTGALTTCGVGQTTLVVGASCEITVQFLPLTTAASNSLLATLSVTAGLAGPETAALTGTATGPYLASIAPTSGARGATVPVTLTGLNLLGASAVTVSGTGVTCTGLTSTTTTVNANCAITATAALGARTVSVTAAGGISNTVTFTVVVPAVPTLTSIAPNSGVRGTVVPVILTGANLTAASAVTVSAGGGGGGGGGGGAGAVTCTIVATATTATTVNANCTIPANATLSARTVSVTTPGGTSNTVTFTVQGATLSTITPITGVRGTSVPVTLTGANLTGATAVTISGTNVTCTGLTSTATTVNANCAITAGAALGARNVTVTTPIGATNTLTGAFTVTGATVAIGAPAPVLTTTTANTTTKTGTITVSNAAAATGPLTLTANPTIAKVGGAGGTFSIPAGGTCVSGFVVSPGASCTINVQYVPGGTPATATATANVTVTGTGLATASQTSGNFTAN
jgi:hypothetical protein